MQISATAGFNGARWQQFTANKPEYRVMEKIMVSCPATGKHVSTGLHTDKDTFDHLPAIISNYNCPHCGTTHHWTVREAWLDSQKPTSFDPASGSVMNV